MSRSEEKGGGVVKLVILGVVLAVLAVTLSEGLRDRVLDALFGAEEEFDYEPAPADGAQSVNGSAATAGQSASA